MGDTISSARADPALVRLVEALEPLPAWVMTRWWDVLACNQAYRELTGDRDAGLPGVVRNICRQSFTVPAIQRIFADWPAVEEWFATDLRISVAAWPSDPAGTELVAQLRRESRRFAQLWDRPEPAPAGRRIVFDHPRMGSLELDVVRLARPEVPRQYLVALVPPDAGTSALLETLAG